MRIALVLLSAVLVLSTAACTSLTSDINTDFKADPFVDFSTYKTYTWFATGEILYDPIGQWEPHDFDADAEIKYLIDRELRKRGLVEDSAKADLFVAFVAGVDMAALKLKENPETKNMMLANIPQGALAITLVERSTGYVIWVGRALGEVKGKKISSDDARKRLDYAVCEMIDQLPK